MTKIKIRHTSDVRQMHNQSSNLLRTNRLKLMLVNRFLLDHKYHHLAETF
jgi:hypothetical protein